MKIKINFFVFLAISLLLFSCDDIFEEDITNATLVPIYPGQNSVITGETVHFQWATVEGADDYRIQVYENNAGIILDSLVPSNNFFYNLDPGAYSWRARAENFAYQSAYNFPVDFTVEATDELTEQNILLTSPPDQIYTNDKNTVYSWQGLNAATSYIFELGKNSNGTITILYTNASSETNHTVPETIFDEDATFVWQVKGINDFSETTFSERSIFLDTTEPSVPILATPADTFISNISNIDFSWNMGDDTGNIQSPRDAIIQIATDVEFTNIVIEETTNNEDINLSFENSNTFYWRVKLIDEAGNEGNLSEVRSFTIN